MVRALRSMKYICILLALSGCQTAPPFKPLEQALIFNAFSTGSLRLSCPTAGCGIEFGANRQKLAQLYNSGNWRELVLEIARINFDSDQSYAYLAKASEQLYGSSVAKIYYENAVANPNKCISGCDFNIRDLIGQRLVIERQERILKDKAEADRLRRQQADELEVERSKKRLAEEFSKIESEMIIIRERRAKQEQERIEYERKKSESENIRLSAEKRRNILGLDSAEVVVDHDVNLDRKSSQALAGVTDPEVSFNVQGNIKEMLFYKRWQIDPVLSCSLAGGNYVVWGPNVSGGRQAVNFGKSSNAEGWISSFKQRDYNTIIFNSKLSSGGVVIREFEELITYQQSGKIKIVRVQKVLDRLAYSKGRTNYKTDRDLTYHSQCPQGAAK